MAVTGNRICRPPHCLSIGGPPYGGVVTAPRPSVVGHSVTKNEIPPAFQNMRHMRR